jgi:hypothetical protein
LHASTDLELLPLFELDGLLARIVTGADLGALGVQENGDMGGWPRLEGLSDPHHLYPMFFVVSMAEIEPRDTHPLVNEFTRVFWGLGFGSA